MFKKYFWLLGFIFTLFIYLSWQPPGVQAHEGAEPTWVWQNSAVQGNTLNRVSCSSPTDCWAVGNAGALLHYDGITWTQNSATFKNLYDISCVSSAFCFAVGQDQLILKYNGTNWLPDPFGLAENDDIYAVSCTSVIFCMAGGFGEYFYKYDGLNWQRLPQTPEDSPIEKPQHAGFENIYSLKCLTSTKCLAAGEEHIWDWNGLTWSEVISEEEEIFRDLSCISASHCFAVMSADGIGNAGAIWEYDGVEWEESLETSAWLLGISCFAEDFCASVGRKGTIYHYDGITWTLTASGVTSVTLNGLICPAEGDCWAVGERGIILTATNNLWQTLVQPISGPTIRDVQCLSVFYCNALDSAGNFYWYDGYSWVISPNIAPGFIAFDCYSEKNCYLIGPNSIKLVSTEISIIGIIKFLPPKDFKDIDCTDSFNCWIVGKNITDGKGIIVGKNVSSNENNVNGNIEKTWSQVEVAGLDRGLQAVACPASNYCWAVGESGLLVHYNGQQWQKQPDAPGLTDFTAISCVSVNECRAVGNDNDILTWNGTTWSAADLPVALYPTSLSCPATNFCYVAGQTGEGVSVLSLQAGSWYTETVNNSYQLTAISCGNRLNCLTGGEQGTLLAKVAGLTVTAPTDNGSVATEGTLSHALANAEADYVIKFQLLSGITAITVSNFLPPVPAGVSINGGCVAGQPQISLVGQANAPGLRLGGLTRLHGLFVQNFAGPQIATTAPGNRLSCTVAKK